MWLLTDSSDSRKNLVSSMCHLMFYCFFFKSITRQILENSNQKLGTYFNAICNSRSIVNTPGTIADGNRWRGFNSNFLGFEHILGVSWFWYGNLSNNSILFIFKRVNWTMRQLFPLLNSRPIYRDHSRLSRQKKAHFWCGMLGVFLLIFKIFKRYDYLLSLLTICVKRFYKYGSWCSD